MKRSTKIFFLGLAPALVCGLAFGQANLLVNGDFEQGNVGFHSDYPYSPGNLAPKFTYDVAKNPHDDNGAGASFGDHTTGHGLMFLCNGADFSPAPVAWSETIQVAPATPYAFSGWMASWGQYVGTGIDPSPAVLQMNINGLQQGGLLTVPAPNGQWQQFNIPWDSESATQALIQIYELNQAFVGGDVAFDDFSFEAVPEPASCSLLALAGMGLLGRRKR